MNFVYFIPDAVSDDTARARIKEIGLDKSIDMDFACTFGTEHTPTGLLGAFVAPGKPGTRGQVGYFKDTQTWTECDGGKFWIGYQPDKPPTPDELARPEQVDGYYARLEDGNDWVVPVARQFAGGTKLLESLCLSPDGQAVTAILPRFVAISKLAERIFDIVVENNSVADTDQTDLIGWASQALAVNYFVDKWAMSALNILTTRNVQDILMRLIDGPMWTAVLEDMEAEKKNTSGASSNTTSGDPGSLDPTTGQPSDR